MQKQIVLLEKLKALEPSAKTITDKFDVYWLEGDCYADLLMHRERLQVLEKCVALARSDKRKKYEELPSLLQLLASIESSQFGDDKKATEHINEAATIDKDYSAWVAQGHELDKICKLRVAGPPTGNTLQLHSFRATQFMKQEKYQEAATEAKLVATVEEESFPQRAPGNATITHVLMYAEALKMLGKKEEAANYVESVLSKVNKVGELPEWSQYPNRQKAIACDLLVVYHDAIYWFKANGMPKRAEKYASLSKAFAKFYQLQYDPYSKTLPFDSNAKPLP